MHTEIYLLGYFIVHTIVLYLYGQWHDLVLYILIEQNNWSCYVLRSTRVCAVGSDALQDFIIRYVDVSCLK